MAKNFVHFWPHITSKKGAKQRANWVMEPIKKHHKNAKSILELGVGIGQVLVGFPKKYDIHGLDCHKEYIAYCNKHRPRGKFYVASMHDFRINKKFDVIFSVYDSICFLESFIQWKQTFNTVHNHLDENGLFIFDSYTPKILKDFKNKGATVSSFSKGYIFDKAIIKGNTLTWDFKVFEKIGRGKFELNEYKFKEIIHPTQKIKKALSKKFTILDTKLMEEGRRILFICKKR